MALSSNHIHTARQRDTHTNRFMPMKISLLLFIEQIKWNAHNATYSLLQTISNLKEKINQIKLFIYYVCMLKLLKFRIIKANHCQINYKNPKTNSLKLCKLIFPKIFVFIFFLAVVSQKSRRNSYLVEIKKRNYATWINSKLD